MLRSGTWIGQLDIGHKIGLDWTLQTGLNIKTGNSFFVTYLLLLLLNYKLTKESKIHACSSTRVTIGDSKEEQASSGKSLMTLITYQFPFTNQLLELS